MEQQLAVGVDIGGTKIAFALVDSSGGVVVSHRLPTDPRQGAESVLDRVAEGIQYLATQTDSEIAGIGVGSPGHVDPQTGIVRNAVNLAWTEVHLREGMARRLGNGLPIWVQKDANAAALGEKYFGAARGCSDFIYIAIGTGLGAGAVVNGEIVNGANAYAMEIGHLALQPEGRLCACGLRGCPEMYIAGVGLLAAVREHAAAFPDSALTGAVTTTAILDAAREGDALALTVMNEAAHWLATVMGYTAVLFNPALFVLGGGLGHAAADFYLNAAFHEMLDRVLPASRENLQIVESQIQSSAVGAACLVWHELNQH